MKIATFNINGIKARKDALSGWIESSDPDVVLLQEIKSVDDGFPRSHFEDMGYNVETNGQKGFNGVAILSKRPIEDVNKILPGDIEDNQARWIEATIPFENKVVRVCSLYAPNGNPIPGLKYEYKLKWMRRLFIHAEMLLKTEIPIVLGGDYNVIPQKIDAANIEQWAEDALFLPQSKSAFRKLLNIGYIDSFRVLEKEPGHYTFWDYQAGSWNRNNGIRIDHLLLNPSCADYLDEVGIDSEIRGYEKPSDHVPIWIKLQL